jgi:hypothetical protein
MKLVRRRSTSAKSKKRERRAKRSAPRPRTQFQSFIDCRSGPAVEAILAEPEERSARAERAQLSQARAGHFEVPAGHRRVSGPHKLASRRRVPARHKQGRAPRKRGKDTGDKLECRCRFPPATRPGPMKLSQTGRRWRRLREFFDGSFHSSNLSKHTCSHSKIWMLVFISRSANTNHQEVYFR